MRNLSSKGLTLGTYVIAFLYFFPVLWIFITGFKTEKAAAQFPPSFIFDGVLKHFQDVWNSGVLDYMYHSAIVTVCSTLLALLLGVPVAYALAMYRIKHADDILFWFISTRFLPVAGIIIPLTVMFNVVHLLDSSLALILVYAGMNTPLVVWMMRSFFKDLPYELIESSQVDGASGLQGFFQITLPITKSGLVATILICMVFAWNEFFYAVTLTYTDASTMPVYMSSFMSQEGLFWAQMSAAASFAILPVLLLGWFSQKSLVRGLTMGAVKG